jgi:carbonic anhydrase
MRKKIILTVSGLAISWLTSMAVGEEPWRMNPKEALKQLKEGNQRFVGGTSSIQKSEYIQRRSELANGQKPFAIVISCSDSRVGPEIVLDQGLGDIFVVRSAGHVVDDIALGSIEYAVEHLGSSLVLVLGHERCGAVAAAVTGGEAPGHLGAVLNPIKPAVEGAKGQPGDLTENAIRSNVRRVVKQLRESSSTLDENVRTGKLRIAGACYDLDTGLIEFVESEAVENAEP